MKLVTSAVCVKVRFLTEIDLNFGVGGSEISSMCNYAAGGVLL